MKIYGKEIDKEIETYTVGDDFLVDKKLIQYDILASIAHAKMLEKTGLISSEESTKLVNILKKIKDLKINKSDEDVHTTIENHLVKKLGNIGKKIHTGRSRNDQVTVAIRLYTKDNLKQTIELVEKLIKTMKKFGEKNDCPIPGYTHMQKAMPSSIKMWINGYCAALSDCLTGLKNAFEITNQNPLGSGAGYGTNLKLDKKYTSKLLGFSKEQETTYVQISRGLIEAESVFALSHIMDVLGKLCSDLLLFTTSEFGYFSLPDSMVTGSSIMPQKKNYDVLELIRAKSKVVFGNLITLKSTAQNLPSGYNRDFQLLKKPLFDSFDITISTIKIMDLIIKNIDVKKEVILKNMTSELYATHKVNELVKKGVPFRDAYKKIKKEYK